MSRTARKLTMEEANEIRTALKLHEENCPKELARKYNVNLCVIYQVKQGKTYQNGKEIIQTERA